MSDAVKQESKFWALIGKASIAVALLVGLITIWNTYTTPGAKLEARAFWGPYLTEPGHEDLDAKIKEIISDANLLRIYKKDVTHYTDETMSKRAAEWLSLKLEEELSAARRQHIKDPGGYWKINITNPGELIIRGATLRLPEAVVARVTIDGKAVIDTKLPEVELGDLAPGGSVEVFAWSEPYTSASDYEEVTLYHAGGKVPVQFPESDSIVAYALDSPFMIFLILIGMIMVFALVFIHGHEAGTKAERAKSNVPSEPPKAPEKE